MTRLVCNLCGLFIAREAFDGIRAYCARCGMDTGPIEIDLRRGRRRQKRLPGLPRVKRIKKGLDG